MDFADDSKTKIAYMCIRDRLLTGKIPEYILESDFFAFRDTFGLIENPATISNWLLHSVPHNIIIKEAKNKERNSMLLIATQVIEAGVDIDMDIGFKNISILDADEQFLGRINRSCKKKNCKVCFFKLDEGNLIYKSDVRIRKEFTLLKDVYKRQLLYILFVL